MLAAGASLAVLAAFAEEFATGATWSGLNPTGGGPGFGLLLGTGCASLFVRSSWVRSMPALNATAFAAVMSAACGALFYIFASRISAFDSIELAPLTSGVIGSFFVPRVVVAVLNETWSRAESQQPEKGHA
ncbi:MAG: hypothetical protein AAF747_05375 [Planctomycetota bacterium]